MIKCECGCGVLIDSVDRKNRPRRFVPGHHNRLKTYIHEYPESLKPYKFAKGHKPFNIGQAHLPGKLNGFYGKKHSEESRAKMRGAKNGNWRNGASRANDLVRKSVEYIDWRTTVFLRDNRLCVICGSGEQIEADHIKPFSTYPELRFETDNGRTLCHSCHAKTDTYGNSKKTRVIDEV